MQHDTTARLNAFRRQREALMRVDRFATIVGLWAGVCNALTHLTAMSTAGNHLLDPAIQTPEIRKDFCRQMLRHLAIVVPFSFLAAQIGEAIQNFLCATIRTETHPHVSSIDDNIIDRNTLHRWHVSFHQIRSEVCTQFRWAISSHEDAEADLIIANAGVRDAGIQDDLQQALEDRQPSDTEVDTD